MASEVIFIATLVRVRVLLRQMEAIKHFKLLVLVHRVSNASCEALHFKLNLQIQSLVNVSVDRPCWSHASKVMINHSNLRRRRKAVFRHSVVLINAVDAARSV